jgi:hypothetical protein
MAGNDDADKRRAGDTDQRRAGDADQPRAGDADQRHVWGPRAVGTLVPGLTRAAFRKRSPAGVQVLTDWDAIVGPALAATTTPRRLSGTTLTISCIGPVAMELQHMAGPLMARINGHLGRVAVERLRFVQDAEPHAAPAALPRPDGPPPPIPGVPAGPLHDALASLGQAVQRAARRPRG